VAEFTHLHLHTQYSLLDGAIRVNDLFPRLDELGMKTVAVTYGYGHRLALRDSAPDAMIEVFDHLPRVLRDLESEP